MPDGRHASLEALIARRRPGYTLEAPFCTSPAFFDLDMDVIFGRHRIHVGIEPDVPEPGNRPPAPAGCAAPAKAGWSPARSR